MTNEENIKAILESNFAGFKDEIIERTTKSILELEPKKSDDAIHRGDVLNAINDFCRCVEEYGAYNKLYNFVEQLPAVSVWEKVDAYKQGWEDAIQMALKETLTVLTEDGIFSMVQEETLIGVGMSCPQESEDKE